VILDSIPRNFIQTFIAQTPDEKHTQLKDLWKIVWGIRVFNKTIDKGGAGITNYNIQVNADIKTMCINLMQDISFTSEKIAKYEQILQCENVRNLAKEQKSSL